LSRGTRSGAHLASIELHHVSVRLGRHWALRDITLRIEAGQRWLLTGDNGAGKTVLMKLLRGDVWPTPTGRERRTYVVGRERHAQPLIARERIAYLGPEAQDKFERYEWNLTVADVVGTGLTGSDLPVERPSRPQQRRVIAALGDVGLAGLARRRFLTLSYGQRRRVLLARSLVSRPDLLLLDEVLNGLDAASRRAFLRSLRRAAGPRTSWVLSTHRVADRPRETTHVARLEKGRLVEQRALDRGSAAGVSRRSDTATRPRRSIASGRNDQASRVSEDSSSEAPLLRLENVTVFRDYRPVLDRLDWELARRTHWSVTGPNGSGKSTLMALLYGDIGAAYGGAVHRAGIHPGVPIEKWKDRVGLVSPELQAVYSGTENTVEEIVVSGLHSSIGLNRPPSGAEIARARKVLRALGLGRLAARRARRLSYGQLRLVLFARALIARRELLLLDEPFDGLDAAARRRVGALIAGALDSGAQIVIATHHRDDVPHFVTDELVLGAVPRVTSRR
jgi:molybdate transport system ATP-binding protein